MFIGNDRTPSHIQQKRVKILKSFTICFIIMMLGLVCIACAKDSPDKSTVDGVSDEVYEQLVQQYFTAKLSYKIITGEVGGKYKEDSSWVTDHELYDEAEEYADAHDIHPFDAFPNPLFTEYRSNPDQFTEEEQVYIEKVNEFYEASSRVDPEEYDRLQEELVDELDIKDSYNIFDETE